MKISASIAALAALAISVPVANAADSSDWRISSSDENGDVISIASGDETTHGALFSCANDRLVVAVGVEAGDVKEMIATPTRRTRDRDVETSIGDQDSFRSRWTYLPANKVAVAEDAVTARKFYNAAIRGDDVIMNISGKGEVSVRLPSINDAFSSFAKDCSVTNPDK